MRTTRVAGLALTLLLLSCLCAPAALADEAAQIYDPGHVFFIDLTLSSAEQAKLEAKPTKYVNGTFSMTKSANGTPGGTEVPFISTRSAEIRLKGNVGGSFRTLSEKPGFKLRFKQSEAVLGLAKMTLNNMVQDPSMVHETLAYAAFRAAGVPASRTGYAYVRLNGEDIGVYLDLENLDEVGLARIFGSFDKSTQHLYEGEGGHDVKPGEETEFEVDEGSEEDISDLEDLIEAVNSEPGEGESWSERVAPNVDLAEMTRMWAVEKYIDHWDGYSGHAEAGLRPNNYYLFSEPSGRFQMLPWGADQTWIPTKGVPNREVSFDGEGGVLFDKCLEDKTCFRLYWEALKSVTVAIAALGPQALAESTAAMLAPWQAEEIAHGRFEYDATDIEEGPYGVEETIEFIEGRQAEAEEWLAANVPSGEGTEEPEQGGGSSGATRQSSLKSPAKSPAPGSLTVNALFVDHGVLTSELGLSAPGRVGENVSMHTRKGRRRVCSIENKPVTLAATLRCQLSKAAKRRLGEGDLRLKVTIGFAPQTGGAVAVVSRTIAAHKGSGA
ncbi:MAG TPA: CotH kinase family protein [Solirubrobacterales bacterium]|jgi:hypothetical protein|nr:CotH kinase family protein [Solirubrobacterales bacterium]